MVKPVLSEGQGHKVHQQMVDRLQIREDYVQVIALREIFSWKAITKTELTLEHTMYNTV